MSMAVEVPATLQTAMCDQIHSDMKLSKFLTTVAITKLNTRNIWLNQEINFNEMTKLY